MKKILIFGMGYVGQHLAAALENKYEVIGTVRDDVGVNQIKWNAVESNDEIVRLIAEVDAVLCCIPPDDDGDVAYTQFGEVLRNSKVKWVGYLSTTGVYGDHLGEVVDENTAVNPQNARAKRRVLAEAQWQSLSVNESTERSVYIFRLPGIYGVGRSAFDALKAGRAKRVDMRIKRGRHKDKPHFFCRAHVDDIVQVIVAALEKRQSGTHIYNIVDDLPMPQAEIVSFAAEMMGETMPPLLSETQAEMSVMAQSFYAECKFMLNGKIKAELGVVLKHSTYKHGLRAIWQQIKA